MTETMELLALLIEPDSFMARAALAGIGLALAAGPLGCFVVWRRMAYFGDATAHAAILGVALALALEIIPLVGVLAASAGMALIVGALAGRRVAADTLLGVAAHGALAIGLVAVALVRPPGLSLEAYLFGEILAVGWDDVITIWVGALLILGLLAWRWQRMLTATLGADLARAADIDPRTERIWLTLMLAMTVAVALKVVGVLLVTAMLIIPAATARPLSGSPEAMAVLAAGVGVLSVIGGLVASVLADTPAGPSIVSVALAFCIAAAGAAALARLLGGAWARARGSSQPH